MFRWCREIAGISDGAQALPSYPVTFEFVDCGNLLAPAIFMDVSHGKQQWEGGASWGALLSRSDIQVSQGSRRAGFHTRINGAASGTCECRWWPLLAVGLVQQPGAASDRCDNQQSASLQGQRQSVRAAVKV